MAKIYSKDFRECVVENVLNGMSHKEAFSIFKVSLQTISNWLRWHRERGDLSTPKRGRYVSKKLSDDELASFIESNNDNSLDEVAEHFNMSRTAIWHRLKVLNITRKKNHTLRRAGRKKA